LSHAIGSLPERCWSSNCAASFSTSNSKHKAHDDYAGHDPHDAQRISDGVGKSRSVGQRFVGLQSSLLGGSQGRRVCGRPGEKTRRRSKSDSKKHGEDQRQESPANDDRGREPI
jgi:hypothetical protein